MVKTIDEKINALLETSRMKDMICGDDITFKRMLELMAKMHYEARGYHVVIDEGHPAFADTPEG